MVFRKEKLVGKNVELIPLEANHLEALYEASKAPEIWAHMPKKVETLEDAKAFIDEALEIKATGSQFPFIIFHRETGKAIGSTRFLEIDRENKGIEIGFTWLNPSVWRTSVNTECKYLLLQYCFEELKYIRVQFKTDILNVRSQTAIARLGAKKEGILRNQKIRQDGTYRDSVYFSIIESEWEEVKSGLEAKQSRS